MGGNTSADPKVVEWLTEDPSTHISKGFGISHTRKYATVKIITQMVFLRLPLKQLHNIKQQISNSWGETFDFAQQDQVVEVISSILYQPR